MPRFLLEKWPCFGRLKPEGQRGPEGVYIPGTQMTSIFEGQPPKTRPFPIKTRVSRAPGIYILD